MCRWHMTMCHTTNKYENFRRFVRGRVVKGVISLNEEYMQIIELLDSSELLRSKMMQERWNNTGVKVDCEWEDWSRWTPIRNNVLPS